MLLSGITKKGVIVRKKLFFGNSILRYTVRMSCFGRRDGALNYGSRGPGFEP